MTTPATDAVVIGAGPYGLSTFAHLRDRGLRVRIFGETMGTWASHMPAGMFLKSTPAASNLTAAQPGFALPDYCRAIGTEPPTGDDPVPLDLFLSYGRWFAEQLAPTVERAEVRRVERAAEGFRVTTGTGEHFGAASVIVASGLLEHAYIPAELAALATGRPEGAPVSHSSQHADLSVFSGQDVAVVGAGQSALESAALLTEAGARPTVIARRGSLRFAEVPEVGHGAGRPWRKPASPLGPGWSLFACSRAPCAFRRLPDKARLDLVARILGPSGAWWLRERFEDRVPVEAGQRVVRASTDGSGVVLHLVGADGFYRVVRADHALSATGYRVGAGAFAYLDTELRHVLRRLQGWPRLRSGFESSVPGLYFVGFPAAASFGPLMRFVCGTDYAAPRVADAVAARSRTV